jgi:RNA recognition motif-containing protein
MSEFGTIGGMRIIHQRGFGYVRYLDVESAHKAVDARSAEVAGRKIRIDSCEDMPTLPHPYRPVPGSKPIACTTLFVGNLAGDATEEEILSYFRGLLEPVGIPVQSVSLRKGGVKGLSFAHVRFANGQDCEQAVACVAGGCIKGTRIRIDWAVDKPGIQDRSTLNAELRGKTNKIFIAGLNDNVLDNDVMQAFGGFGEITSLRLNRDKAGVRSFGYITFSSPDAASAAMDNVASIQIPGVKLRADFAKPDRPPAGHVEAPSRGRSPSPEYPRFTPVSYAVPPEYGPMRSWIDCYGKSMVGGSF